MIDSAIIEKFWGLVQKETGTFCWAWIGRKDSAGYGLLGRYRAHRLAWQLHNGEIPPGKFICHRCDNPECTNPDHLFLGDAYQNNLDRATKRRIVRPKNHAFDSMRKQRSRQGGDPWHVGKAFDRTVPRG